MTTHALPPELLADYASGAASPGLSLLVAAHLTYAPGSRRDVALMESVGGALLSAEAPASLSPAALEDALAVLDRDPGDGGAASAAMPAADMPAGGGGLLPRPVLASLGCGEDEIPWSFRLPGVSEHVIEAFGPERVSLLRARPGAGIPQHTHEGTEITLVLSGALEDEGAIYRRGDVAVNTEEHDHRPRILGAETCVCLIVMEGGLRFTGRFSRALNYIAE